MASFDPAILRSACLEILQALWSHGISAELAKDAGSPEDLLTRHRDENYCWIVIVKQDRTLKIKTMGRKDVADADIPTSQLLAWLKPEIRDRDARTLTRLRGAAQADSSSTLHTTEAETEQEVRVLVAQTKSKKFNRRAVVEQAQVSAQRLVQSFLDGPVAAIETTDGVMDMIRQTSLSDPESWRKVEQGVTTAEKKYVKEIHDMLDEWRWKWESKKGTRHAFVYNFRTGTCLYYDLGS